MTRYTPATYFVNPAHEEIARSRYFLKDGNGNSVEQNVFETFKRVNDYIYQNDSQENKALAQRLCEDKKIMYAGRPLAQAGTGIRNMFNCYSKHAPVVTERGVIPISDIRKNDRVLTEDGTFQLVLNSFSQGYREKLLRINVDRMPKVLDVTPDHKILTKRGWVEAENLTEQDYVAVPGFRDSQPAPAEIRLLDFIRPSELGKEPWILEEHNGCIYKVNQKDTSIYGNRYSAKTNPINAAVLVDNDLAKLLGYYISEGCADKSGNMVIFTYNSDEKEFITETKYLVDKVFGVKASINPSTGGNWTQVVVSSRLLNNFFKNWIGPSFSNKILPWWVLNTDLDFQRLVLAYTCRGDAHVKSTGQALLTMCNPTSMMQMFFIAQKLGLAYSLKYGSKKKDNHSTPVVLNIAHDRAQAGEFIEFAHLVNRYVPDTRYWRKVTSIEEVAYKDNVWDISVENNHSLQIAGMVGSNCFVLDIDDSRDSISETQRIHFHIQAHGGGTGFNFSKLRPAGSWCKGANARSSGPEGFITSLSYLSANIAQGGNRSGANLGLLEDWHPGFFKFITKKSRSNWENIRKFSVIVDENKFKHWQSVHDYAWQTFNVSVGLSDEFMRQVKRKSKKPWNFHWKGQEWFLWDFVGRITSNIGDEGIITEIPITVCAPDQEIALYEALNEVPFRNKETLELVKGPYNLTAAELFEKICHNAWADGCPGVIFLDTIRKYHNGEYFNPVLSTNPCHRGNSLIHTDRGLVTIESLVNELFTVVTPTGELARAICFPTGTKPIYRVRFKQGGYIDLTLNHNLIAYDSKQKISVANLYPGCRVLAPTLPISPLQAPFSGEKEDGFLLGWVFGDGCIFSRKSGKDTGRKCLFTMVGKNDGEDIADFVIKKLNLLKTNRRRDLHWRGRNGNKEVVTSDRGVLSWFSDRFAFKTDKEKGFPHTILQGSRDLQIGFLQGLFAADGSVAKSGRKITLTSSREEVLFHTKCLLNTFGIDSTYRTYHAKRGFIRHDLTITGREAVKFVKRIGFGLHTRKNSLCAAWNGKLVQTNKNYATVMSITSLGIEEKVYNITVDHDLHQYLVNSIVSSNCGEQPLPAWSVCCLSSIVLPEFVEEDGSIDWDGLKEAVAVLVRSLNWITLLNEAGVEQIDHNTRQERRIGLGTIGMHEMLIRLSLRGDKEYHYSKPSGRHMAKKVLKFIKHAAYEASIELAKEIGPFPAFKFEEFIQSEFMKQLLEERPDLKDKLKAHGIANVTVLTQAPTGTTGTITGYSSGCEPYYAMAYRRNSNIGTVIDGCPSFLEWLQGKNVDYSDYDYNLKKLRRSKRVPKVFEEAHEISWEDHLKMQAVFAEQIDSSVSKTINVPNGATAEDIMEAYIRAYDMGIKSTAVYRDGSKVQVLETMQGAVKHQEDLRPKTIITIPAPKRPEILDCDIQTVSVKGEKWKVLVGLLYGRPYETFCFPEDQIEIPSSKTEGVLVRNGGGKYNLEIPYGDDKWVIKNIASQLLTDEHRMITRLISTSLRHGAPLNALVSQLSKCDGEVTAFSKAMMRVLRKYITDEEYLAVSVCQECQSRNLIMQDGCLKCADCSYSACN